jgi:hypothetical protein
LWDFGTELPELREVGLSGADLRWLVCRGLIEQATELLPPQPGARRFHKADSLAFDERTCFALTAAGVKAARELGPPEPAARLDEAAPHPGPHHWLVPRWDGECRELTFLSEVVKRFRQPAPSQEAVLAAFESRGWPPRIEDPLTGPGFRGGEPLHDTIKNLNRHQLRPLLRFHGDGTGCGIVWSRLGLDPPPGHPTATLDRQAAAGDSV